MEDADDANEISQREMTEALFDLSWRDQSLFVQKIQEIHKIFGPEEAHKQIKLLENPYAKSSVVHSPRYALTVLPEYCRKILHEGKTWEIRGQRCGKHLNERICIAESGSGMLVGEMVISESRLISRRELEENPDKHKIEDLNTVGYKNIYAWTVTNVKAYSQPKPYRRPMGTVNWVDLEYYEPERASQRRRASMECANVDCNFGLTKKGGRGKPFASSQDGARFDCCLFCDPDAFLAALHFHEAQSVHRALARLAKRDPDLRAQAVQRIRDMRGPQVAARFVLRCGPRRPRMKKVKKTTVSLEEILKPRQPPAKLEDEQSQATRDEIQRKQRKALKKKFPSIYADEARDESTWMPPRAVNFRNWCLRDSWRACSQCKRMVPQDYRRSHAKGTAKGNPQIKACAHCKSGGNQGYWAPTPDDVPRRLRKLSARTIEALRPFQIHPTGAIYAPNGYLVHLDMMQFSFKPVSVEVALTHLPRKERRRGEKALRYLKRADGTADTSAYLDFWRMHQNFLQQRERAIERGDTWAEAPIKRMPANFIETAGLECALWPHLYWNKKMTETYVRSQDARRLSRQRATMDAEDDDEMGGEDAAWRPPATRQSAKASFLAKVHSAVIGYNSDGQLLQFIYDLWLFTTIGGAKNASGIGVREALATKPYSPEVWRTYHLALVDLQKQIGWPTLFITIAPYEWSFPYHAWLED